MHSHARMISLFFFKWPEECTNIINIILGRVSPQLFVHASFHFFSIIRKHRTMPGFSRLRYPVLVRAHLKVVVVSYTLSSVVLGAGVAQLRTRMNTKVRIYSWIPDFTRFFFHTKLSTRPRDLRIPENQIFNKNLVRIVGGESKHVLFATVIQQILRKVKVMFESLPDTVWWVSIAPQIFWISSFAVDRQTWTLLNNYWNMI